MGLFDKLNELNDKIDAIIPGGKKNVDADLARRQKVPGVPAITREHPGEDNDNSNDSNGEKQEVINGHLVVDGVDLGPVNTGSLSVQEDVLNILGIPASYSVPDRILLPGDLAKVKFAKEPDGFARDEVAAFYDATCESIDFYIDLLNKRNADVAKLADHCTKLQDEIHDKELESEIQKTSGLNIIAGGDSNSELMNAKLKIRKLKAENEELRQQSSSTEATEKIKELQKRYDEVQDQLAMEQYNNKQLRAQLADMQTKRDFESEMGNTGFAESMSAFNDNSPSTSSQRKPDAARASLKRKPKLARVPDDDFDDSEIMSAAEDDDNKPAHPSRMRMPLKRGNASSANNASSASRLSSARRNNNASGNLGNKHRNMGASIQKEPSGRLMPTENPIQASDDDVDDMFEGSAPFDDLTDTMIDDDIDLSFD